ncbi:hypothetical protein IV203_012497 [Nitzschia inconspicua]|uniref:Uncharacterized protein n=1 Tax=Nitzschia inconspicua TaxID=303405 RepID=A0A9K3PJT4_9STRA|nr:hypothetical protein IV203_012735 [Nitzschia inconspicua]KAG7349900.1 hypothetical protein IV203_012497 [Nitzschia inconspicua]
MAENAQLSAALRLNDEAVSLLVAGQERKALLQLQQAVSIVKRSIARHLQRGQATATNSESHKHEMTLEQLHQDSVQLSGLNNLQCFVYNRAFRVSSDQLPSLPIEKAAQTGSAIIIFNMALVLHRACLLQNRTVPASKALALYKIVLHLIKSSSSASPASSSMQDIARAIQVAALNNMAQLRFEDGQYAQATRDFGSLANLMTTIQQAPLGATEMRGIVINILCLKKGAKFAPAA